MSWPSAEVQLIFPLLCPVISFLSRVINAGKSTLNEDQACCEVLVVKRRPAGSSTPNRTSMTRRRSSLPNGEGLGLRECLVSQTNGFAFVMKYSPFPPCPVYYHRKWWGNTTCKEIYFLLCLFIFLEITTYWQGRLIKLIAENSQSIGKIFQECMWNKIFEVTNRGWKEVLKWAILLINC